MKIFSLSAAFVLISLAASPVLAANAAAFDRGPVAAPAQKHGARYVAEIDGIATAEDQSKVKDCLEKIDGVDEVEVGSATATLTLKEADGTLTLDQVKQALADQSKFTVKSVRKG